MTYQDTLSQSADHTGAQLAAAAETWTAGDNSSTEFAALAVAFLTAADHRATALADLALAAFLTLVHGRPVAALGLAAPGYDHRPRVRQLIAAAAPVEQWRSYGRGSTLATGQASYQQAMRHRDIPGWTRVLEADACPVCTGLAGDVLPTSVDLWTHDGCGCTQRPILNH